ncbi:MAG: hypothetical protein QNI89_13290 [Desulfobacterales bacterium]|nr:hypothetical protein [Desulfobacterales bacterium]
MTVAKLLNIWPHSPLLSAFFWITVSVFLLYLARTPAHRSIYSLSRVIHNGLRLLARSTRIAAAGVHSRNKEVLFNLGRESTEQIIIREFQRVDGVIKRDLSRYPMLQRDMSDQIVRMDQDYLKSAELPPPVPTWVDAITALGKISSKDASVAAILEQIHKTINSQHKGVLDEYRRVSSDRHAILHKMMPLWRRLSETLEQASQRFTGLNERAQVIDRHMQTYQEIQDRSEKADRMLTSSAATQFFIAGFVLMIAIGGAIINFNLIALPMSEMVGGGSYIGAFKTSDVAALVIILVELAMGLYLMESLRITRLFPIIGQMDDRTRRRMVWITFTILFIMAGVEASLAFMRDRLAADIQALRQSLADVEVVAAANNWIPTVGQMVMGFILPFALAFVAIPLESFVHAARTVLGSVLAALLNGLAFAFRLVGNVVRYGGEFGVNLYDLAIFPSLWIERLILEKRRRPEATKAADTGELAEETS